MDFNKLFKEALEDMDSRPYETDEDFSEDRFKFVRYSKDGIEIPESPDRTYDIDYKSNEINGGGYTSFKIFEYNANGDLIRREEEIEKQNPDLYDTLLNMAADSAE